MSDDDRRVRGGEYRTARMAVAGTLTGLVVVLLLLDAVNPTYHLSEVTLGALVGAILTLLGVEVANVIRGSK